MNLKPSETLVATCSLGLAAVGFSVTELATYAGPGIEFVAPLLGLAWVVSEVRARRALSKARDEPESDERDVETERGSGA